MKSARVPTFFSFSLMLASCAMAGAATVVTIPVPGGGEAVAARTGADGCIHLLFDTPVGPQYVRSTDDGAAFSRPLRVVDNASRRPGLEFSGSDLAVGKDGRVYVAMSTNAWKLKLPQDEWSLHYATLAPDSLAFAPVRNLNVKPSQGFSLAADQKGDVVASWLSGKLYANVSHDNGVTFSPNTELNPVYDPCPCCTTSTAFGTDGRLALLYREERDNERDMYVVVWSPDGRQVRSRVSGTPWKIDACPMSDFSINRAGNGYVAAWPTKGEVYFAHLNADGKVLAPGEVKTPGTAKMHTGVLALAAPDGTTLVAWKVDGVLGWQVYDAQGQPQGAAGSVRSAGLGAAGTVDRNGRFLLFR